MNNNPLPIVRAGLLALALACTAAVAAPPTPTPAAALKLAFEELWEPRTVLTGVYGVVTSPELKPTADGSDPQQPWAVNTIRTKWGTLRSLDGTVPGFPDVTGVGPNPSWMIREGKLFFHAAPAKSPNGPTTDGFALISGQTFPRSRRIVVEADLALTKGSHTAFVGLALIAGEGDYRELALMRRADGKDTIDRFTPLRSNTLALRKTEVTTMRIEYDPVAGFSYFANGVLVGKEALDHSGGHFSSDPGVGLYFTGNPTVPDAFVEGFVGPLRVWVDDAPAVATTTGNPG